MTTPTRGPDNTPTATPVVPALGMTAGLAVQVWEAWPVDARLFAEAMWAARRFRGADVTPAERAWSARVDEALAGLDDLDLAGVDDWMAVHATAAAPELFEARLVAAWDTHQATTTRSGDGPAPTAGAGPGADPDSAAVESHEGSPS
jgi:hypothetical protein